MGVSTVRAALKAALLPQAHPAHHFRRHDCVRSNSLKGIWVDPLATSIAWTTSQAASLCCGLQHAAAGH